MNVKFFKVDADEWGVNLTDEITVTGFPSFINASQFVAMYFAAMMMAFKE